MQRQKLFHLALSICLISILLLACRAPFKFSSTRKTPDEKGETNQELKQEIESLKNRINNLESRNKDLQDEVQDLGAKSIESRANEAIEAIKSKDARKLSSLVHPDEGVRFSPYAYVNVQKDLVFTSAQIRSIFDDTTEYLWGQYDGSGKPIRLTFGEYYKQFVYDQDFANAEKVSFNRPMGQGNTQNNSFEIYPDSIIVEYHFSGIDPQYAGMDWESLRLVFEKQEDIWYLVGVIHDQWTT